MGSFGKISEEERLQHLLGADYHSAAPGAAMLEQWAKVVGKETGKPNLIKSFANRLVEATLRRDYTTIDYLYAKLTEGVDPLTAQALDTAVNAAVYAKKHDFAKTPVTSSNASITSVSYDRDSSSPFVSISPARWRVVDKNPEGKIR